MTRLLLILLTLTVSTYAQKTKTIKLKKLPADSIYYNIFPDGYDFRYELKEIITPKAKEKHYDLKHLFYFTILDKQEEINWYYTVRSEVPVTLNDTIISWAWDIDHKGLGGNHSFFFGKLNLNKNTNTLTVQQQIIDPQKKRRKFKTQYKVLKWTFYEIILKDITHINKDLTYIFRH